MYPRMELAGPTRENKKSKKTHIYTGEIRSSSKAPFPFGFGCTFNTNVCPIVYYKWEARKNNGWNWRVAVVGRGCEPWHPNEDNLGRCEWWAARWPEIALSEVRSAVEEGGLSYTCPKVCIETQETNCFFFFFFWEGKKPIVNKLDFHQSQITWGNKAKKYEVFCPKGS